MDMERHKKILNESDMMKGNINRMCVTDDEAELANMYGYAVKRAAYLYMLNLERIRSKEDPVDQGKLQEAVQYLRHYKIDMGPGAFKFFAALDTVEKALKKLS